MSSRCLELAASIGLAVFLLAPAAARELKVCADPDNLPFSHVNGTGFENRIAARLAAELEASLVYVWQPLGRGFLRRTLGTGACALVIGLPVGVAGVASSRPYYRSAFAFVQRTGELPIQAFDDPRLRRAAIGLLVPGDDMAITPPGAALARRGITANVHGYPPFGAEPPAGRMAADVAAGRLDAAVLWCPQAGYFARAQLPPLAVTTIRGPAPDAARGEFAMAMAVHPANERLLREVNGALTRLQPSIDVILGDYGVPRTDRPRAERASP